MCFLILSCLGTVVLLFYSAELVLYWRYDLFIKVCCFLLIIVSFNIEFRMLLSQNSDILMKNTLLFLMVLAEKCSNIVFTLKDLADNLVDLITQVAEKKVSQSLIYYQVILSQIINFQYVLDYRISSEFS